MTGDQASSASPSAAAAREAALHEILAVLRDSRDDEKPVFDAILRNAQTLCDAPMAGLVLGTAEDAVQSLAAHIGVQPQTIEMFESGRMLMDGGISHSARSILEARTIVFDDMGASDLYVAGSPVVRAMVDESGIRSVLFAPLVRGGAAIGTITLFRHDVDPFDADEIALVESFAAQAVIAIENVRQFRELQTRLEREAATREVLAVISTSRDDEGPVFDAILEAASRLCRAPLAFLTLADETRTNVVVPAYRGTTPEFGAILDTFAEPIGRSELVAVRPVATGEVMRIGDMKDTDLYRSGDPRRLQMVDVEGVRSVVGVPLLRGGVGIGCLVLYRREVAPFSDDDVGLVQAFAAQAVIAIENVRQFRELQARLERESATRGILHVISQSRDDEAPVFEEVLRAAARLCGADKAGLMLGRPDDDRLTLAALHDLDLGSAAARDAMIAAANDPPMTMDPGRHVSAQAILSGEPVAVTDLSLSAPYLAGEPTYLDMVDGMGSRSAIAVPLRDEAGALGAILLHRKRVAPFVADEIALVETFAAQAVIAIENVRQFRELQTRLEREAATREILEVISRSRDDEAPVFDAILRNAQRLCGAPFGNLSMVSPDGARLEIKSDGIAPFEPFRPGWSWPIESGLLVARSVRETAVLQLEDAAEDPIFAEGDPDRVTVVEAGVRTVLTVPLLSGGAAIGSMALFRRERRPFSADEIALVETFAAQAVIAIENVRQFRELQTRLEREAATRRILEVISGSRDDEGPVFDAILEAACRLCDAPLAYLVMADGGGEGGGEGGGDDRRVRCPARRGAFVTFGETLDRLSVQVDSRLALVRSFVEGRVIRIDDIADDDLYRAGDPNRVSMVEDEGARSILVAPLMRGDVGLGSITLYRREVRPFSDDDVALVEAFAAQAVIAIENVRQFKALEALNAELGERVEEQVDELERMGRLKRFLSPQVAQAITSSGDEGRLSSHRALVAVLFADIRGFTAFCESAEPEETIEVLQTYHEEMGRLLHEHGAGVDHRSGDGIMAIFNDPLPCDDPAGDAVRLAVAMRARMGELCRGWRRLGHRLGFGVGVSLGYATVGMVGSEGRYEYTASGTAVNLGARLCDRAADGEILLSPRAAAAVEEDFPAESVGEIDFKGIREPVEVFRLAAAPEA